MVPRLLENIFSEFVVKRGFPIFKVHQQNINLIHSPIHFYKLLLEGIRKSKYRIILSSLYLGTGHMEQLLLEELIQNSNSNRHLKVKIIIDRSRGSRGKEHNSKLLLQSFLAKALYPHNLQFVLIKHNSLPEMFNLLNNSGFCEIFGTFHCKNYVFDDSLILTGANLSEEYFLLRNDRYVVFNNSKRLCDFVNEMTDVFLEIGETLKIEEKQKDPLTKADLLKKFQLFRFNQRMSEQEISTVNKEISRFSNYSFKEKSQIVKEFIEADKGDLGPILDLKQSKSVIKTREYVDSLKFAFDSDVKQAEKDEESQYVYIIPSFQSSFMNVNDDSELLKHLLNIFNESKVKGEVTITSAYLNFKPEFLQLMSNFAEQIKVNFVTGSPVSNSFFKGGFIKSRVPALYRCSLLGFISSIKKIDNYTFYEFSRDQCTFHSKGIWARYSDSNEYLTVLGSSNYSYRSFNRDFESQYYLFTKNQRVISEFEDERRRLIENSSPVNRETIENDKVTEVNSTNKFLYRIFKGFL